LLAPGLLLPDSRVEVDRSGIGVRRQRSAGDPRVGLGLSDVLSRT
jgi:hypothetical protein